MLLSNVNCSVNVGGRRTAAPASRRPALAPRAPFAKRNVAVNFKGDEKRESVLEKQSGRNVLSPEEQLRVGCLPEVPITMEPGHVPAVGLEQKGIPNPGMPRANYAPSTEKPNGSITEANPAPKLTVMQQHILFWDRDGDGIIWPWDTFVGFRRLGFNLLVSTLAVPTIHTLGLVTSPWFPLFNPLLPIHIKNIHRSKHGSDSGVYDKEGRFEPEKFERIMQFDTEGKGGLNWRDMMKMCTEKMLVWDFFGWSAARLEWTALWLIAKDENGVVSKEKIRAQYDGTLWEVIAKEVEEREARKRGDEPRALQAAKDAQDAKQEGYKYMNDSNNDATKMK